MTEGREGYEVHSQREMAKVDETVAVRWLADLGDLENEDLLEIHRRVTNRITPSNLKFMESEQQMKHRAELEMLRRVDNGLLPAPALPDNVYQTWCKILCQKKPRNWEVDCGNGCAVTEPYGWVPEAGCPVHDPDDWIDNYISENLEGA